MAEALAFAPVSVEALAADAQPGARWREDLRLREPSPPLRHAINRITQTARTAAAGGDLPLQAALIATGNSEPDQSALDGLARAVLRSALQQRQPANPANQALPHRLTGLLPGHCGAPRRPCSAAG